MDDVLEMLRKNGMELRVNPHGRAFTEEELLEEVRTVDGVILRGGYRKPTRTSKRRSGVSAGPPFFPLELK
jgi:hypothetical protein